MERAVDTISDPEARNVSNRALNTLKGACLDQEDAVFTKTYQDFATLFESANLLDASLDDGDNVFDLIEQINDLERLAARRRLRIRRPVSQPPPPLLLAPLSASIPPLPWPEAVCCFVDSCNS